MNEYDYYLIEQFCILSGTLSLIIGGFILTIYNQLNYTNTLFLIFIFFVLFGISFYFHNKRRKYELEMMKEIKKYIDEGKNNDFNSS